MQLQEMPWMQNIVKIQISILVCFPLDFVSLWREVCSLFTALMYRTLTLTPQYYNRTEADFTNPKVLHENEV